MTEYRGCELPDDLYYDLDYVWARSEPDGLIALGITDAAQTMAGRVQKIRFKKAGTALAAGRHVATLESGKWAGGIPVPFAATVVSINDAVVAEPHLVNIDPYGEAWLVRLRPSEPASALSGLATGAPAIAALQEWIDRYALQCLRCAER